MEIGIDKPIQRVNNGDQRWKDEREVQQPLQEVLVLTKPLMVADRPAGDHSDDDDDVEYRTPNLVQRVLSLFKNVRPGSDLTTFQLPPSFNYPKSQLQAYGEMVYCAGKDILSDCSSTKCDPLERFTRVVGWSISMNRPGIIGLVPYNPVLGETHHVSSRSLNVRLEQVSHRPPVTALHATDHRHGVDMLWFQRPVPKFQGTRVEVEVQGKRTLKLVEHGETYVMNSPNMTIRFIPPAVDWTGTVKVSCRETGYEAELNYSTSSFFGRRSSAKHSVTGKIYKTSPPFLPILVNYLQLITACSTVKIRDPNGGGERVIYNAKEVASKLKAPILKDPQSVLPSESALVWSEVSRGILSRDWEKAKEAKRAVEEKQRDMAKARRSRGEVWVPKYFTPSSNGGDDDPYEYSPIETLVPPAPIVVPF
ncbi:unnamed protein product [Linum tenue]|uniref:Oxysterol-binding protein n=1 Tax=Linum tenue TaxID=586396 RepID=A0AAV0R9Y8_9ROSI|nr:unnamed protein product [Linum tenue]